MTKLWYSHACVCLLVVAVALPNHVDAHQPKPTAPSDQKAKTQKPQRLELKQKSVRIKKDFTITRQSRASVVVRRAGNKPITGTFICMCGKKAGSCELVVIQESMTCRTGPTTCSECLLVVEVEPGFRLSDFIQEGIVAK